MCEKLTKRQHQRDNHAASFVLSSSLVPRHDAYKIPFQHAKWFDKSHRKMPFLLHQLHVTQNSTHTCPCPRGERLGVLHRIVCRPSCILPCRTNPNTHKHNIDSPRSLWVLLELFFRAKSVHYSKAMSTWLCVYTESSSLFAFFVLFLCLWQNLDR